MKSLEAFIEFPTLFLSFIGFSNRIDRSKTKISKKRPNATQVLKNHRLLSSAVPSVWPNLPKVPAQVVVKQQVHDGMRKKCYFIAVRKILNSQKSIRLLSVSKFKRIFEDAKTDECLTDAVEAFEIVSTWN